MVNKEPIKDLNKSAPPTTEEAPRISIGVLTFNSGRTLRQCLSALFQQEYPKEEFEVIISDGGSTDNTLQIAKEYGVKAFCEPHRTRGRGRNICLEQARGEILVMVDSDEILPSDWLAKAERVYDADPEVVEVSGPYYTPEPNLGMVSKVIYSLTSGWEFSSKNGKKRTNWP